MCNWTLFRHFSIVDQKPFLRVWQKSKWQKMSLCKCENVLPFDLENFLTFGWGKFNRNCFMDWQVCQLHVCQLFLIEFALSKWQKDKDKKATLIWIRKRGFFFTKTLPSTSFASKISWQKVHRLDDKNKLHLLLHYNQSFTVE